MILTAELKGGGMGTAEKKAIKRLGRGIFGLIVSAIIAWFTNDPKLLVLAPIINSAGKYAREKLNLPNVPF